MTGHDPQVGDLIDITQRITGALVVQRYGQTITIDHEGNCTQTFVLDDTYTVTLTPEIPQSGQVWEHPKYGRRMIIEWMLGGLAAKKPEAGGEWVAVEKLNWDGWTKAYPLPAIPTPGETATLPALRRFEDGEDSYPWTETAPGSDLYQTAGRYGLEPLSREEVIEANGFTRDLDPVPATTPEKAA
jgi:hypothetical protein